MENKDVSGVCLSVTSQIIVPVFVLSNGVCLVLFGVDFEGYCPFAFFNYEVVEEGEWFCTFTLKLFGSTLAMRVVLGKPEVYAGVHTITGFE